jgi:hypothetical protein
MGAYENIVVGFDGGLAYINHITHVEGLMSDLDRSYTFRSLTNPAMLFFLSIFILWIVFVVIHSLKQQKAARAPASNKPTSGGGTSDNPTMSPPPQSRRPDPPP